MRAMQSEYMHWAKTRAPVRYHLGSSEVPHFRMDRWGSTRPSSSSMAPAIPLRAAARGDRRQGRRAARARRDGRRHVHGEHARHGRADRAGRRGADRASRPTNRWLPQPPILARACGSFDRQGPDFAIDPETSRPRDAATRLIVLTNLHNPSGNLADEASCGGGALAERDRRAHPDRRGLSRRRGSARSAAPLCSASASSAPRASPRPTASAASAAAGSSPSPSSPSGCGG